MKDLKKLNDFLATVLESLQEINEELRGKPSRGEYAYFTQRAGSLGDTRVYYGIVEDYWYNKDENCTMYVCKGAGVFYKCDKNPIQ